MATDRPRRRRHSPAVYRRRRLVLLLGVLVLVAVVVWLLVAPPWKSAAADAADTGPSTASQAQPAITEIPGPEPITPSPVATESPDVAAATSPPTPNPSGTPAAKPCRTSDVTVTAVTDQEGYDAGENPQLTMTLTNDGDNDCTFNVGTATQSFEITSGDDTWWRSTDCQAEPSDMVVLLTAGQTVSSASPLEWDRTRSSVSSCGDDVRPLAPGGGATFHLTVSIGGVSSIQTTMFMLY